MRTCSLLYRAGMDSPEVWGSLMRQKFDPVLTPISSAARDLREILKKRMMAIKIPDSMTLPKMGPLEVEQMGMVEEYLDVVHQLVLEDVDKNMILMIKHGDVARFLISVRAILGGGFEQWPKAVDLMRILSHVQRFVAGLSPRPVRVPLLDVVMESELFLQNENEQYNRLTFLSHSITITDTYRISFFLSTFGLPRVILNYTPSPPLVQPINLNTLARDALLHLEGNWEGYYMAAGSLDPKMTFALRFGDHHLIQSPKGWSSSRSIVGEGTDGVDRYELGGWVREDTGQFKLVKRYPGHEWIYEGFLNEFGMSGSWGGGMFMWWICPKQT
ncbi:hypothetical protein BC829DRAFT_380780 [Chytridium lagenaria]|nr:hypothetical protein BC829DRAFT_409854 [Chytridium lagenaria]KAI8854289.1 hypothetical protein BC829DRAFT_380780 [Chytridium lagenaria]